MRTARAGHTPFIQWALLIVVIWCAISFIYAPVYSVLRVTAHPILASRLFADCPASPDRQDTHAALPCAASGRPERRVTEALTS